MNDYEDSIFKPLGLLIEPFKSQREMALNLFYSRGSKAWACVAPDLKELTKTCNYEGEGKIPMFFSLLESRIKHILFRYGVFFIGDLIQLRRYDLLLIPYLGPAAIIDIIEYLFSLNLLMRGDSEKEVTHFLKSHNRLRPTNDRRE